MTTERRVWHFGVLSFTGTGHVNPLIVLSQELTTRGHKVTFFEKPKIADRVRQAGLDFVPLTGDNSFPKPTPPAATLGLWSEISTLRFNLKRVANDIEMFLRTAPLALRRSGVDALIVNEVALTGPTVAELLRLPYFIVSTSVPHNFGWSPSPWLSPRDYSGSWMNQLQNSLLELSALRIRGPIRKVIDRHREHMGLSPIQNLEKGYPCMAYITQLPECLDLPRTDIPENFHYTGPFVSGSARPAVDFPWHRIDGRPLIYASLGTTRNVQPFVIRMIAEACRGLNAQLVISLGGRFSLEQFGPFPGDPLVVRYAPQLDLLKLADIVITHAGPNTVFETLMQGVPMIAIPIAHDQPAIAARLARLKLAQVIPQRGLSAEKLRAAVITLLNDPCYRASARQVGAQVRLLHGAAHAADIIEAALARHEDQAQAKPSPAYSSTYASVSS
jgi:MGT family glycosyltransferase